MKQDNKIFLIGRDIKHSKSPELFAAAYPNTNIKYELFETDDFEKSVQMIQEMDCNVIGMNVTSPYKHNAYKIGLDVTNTTEFGQSANCLMFGQTHTQSYNSDLYALKQACIGKHISNVCVIGAGAIGQMCVQYFDSLNIHSIVWYNRTVENIVKIIETKQFNQFCRSQTKIFVESLDELTSDKMQYDVIVWALPICSPELGTYICNTAPNTLIIEPNYKNPTFNHKLTKHLYDGKLWLLNQAIDGFAWLTKTPPNLENMLKIVSSW